MRQYERRSKADRQAIEMLTATEKKDPVLEKQQFAIPVADTVYWGYVFAKDSRLYCPEVSFFRVDSTADELYWRILAKRGTLSHEKMKPRKLPLSSVTDIDQTLIEEYIEASMIPNTELFLHNNRDQRNLYAVSSVEMTGTIRLTLLIMNGSATMTTVICEDAEPDELFLRGHGHGILRIKRDEMERRVQNVKRIHEIQIKEI